MAYVGQSSASKFVYSYPLVYVYINGFFRGDCYCESVDLQSGFIPSEAIIKFPGLRFPSMPVPVGSRVLIYANPHLDPAPIFKGFVSEYFHEYDMASDVTIQCLDERGHLNDDVCQYDYNALDDLTSLPTETLTTREILRDIFNQYVTWQQAQSNTYYLQLDDGAFPDMIAPETIVDGMPHGAAIEQIARASSEDSRRRTYLELGRTPSSRDTLTMMRIGEGPIKRITYARYPTIAIASQPFGYPNADRISWRQRDYNRTTVMQARGRRKRIQTTLTLTESWDQTIESVVLANWEKYTVEKLQDGSKNASFNPWASRVGCRYAIPTISWTNPRTGTAENIQPNILADLVDGDPDDITKSAPPVAIIKYASEAAARTLTSEFSIKDGRFVEFSKPLAIATVATPGAAVTFEMPDSVKLVCAYESRDRLEPAADIGPHETNRYDIRRRLASDAYKWDLYSASTHKVNSDGTISAVVSQTDIEKSLADLSSYGTARLRDLELQDKYIVISCPHGPLYFRIGDRITINGVLVEDANVLAIHYDFWTGNAQSSYNTILTVASGGV